MISDLAYNKMGIGLYYIVDRNTYMVFNAEYTVYYNRLLPPSLLYQTLGFLPSVIIRLFQESPYPLYGGNRKYPLSPSLDILQIFDLIPLPEHLSYKSPTSPWTSAIKFILIGYKFTNFAQ